MASERGFTLTEALLSLTIWGLLIVPFIVYYGGMQKAFYFSHSQLNVLHVSRLTMDQVANDLRRMQTVIRAGAQELCFAYTPLNEVAALNIGYRWDGGRRKLLYKRGGGDLTTFCNDASLEKPMPTFGNDTFISDVAFTFFDGANAPVTPPASFKRIAVMMTYQATPGGLDYNTTTSVMARNL